MSAHVPPPGVIPPLVTPMRPDGAIDLESLARLVAFVRGAGAVGVLVLGSTGEGPHLTPDERLEVVAATRRAAGDLHVMANAVALETRGAARAAAALREAGADSVLAPPPIAFPLGQRELRDHYRGVASAAGGPVVAYHVPSRAPTAVAPATVGELVAEGVLCGVKDSSGDMDNHRRTAMAVRGHDVALLTGAETTIDMAALAGFTGAVPGLANVYPRTEVALWQACVRGDWDEARRLQERLTDACAVYFGPLEEAAFTGVAVGSLKHALARSGVIASATVSAPFGALAEATAQYVEAHLERLPLEVS